MGQVIIQKGQPEIISGRKFWKWHVVTMFYSGELGGTIYTAYSLPEAREWAKENRYTVVRVDK